MWHLGLHGGAAWKTRNSPLRLQSSLNVDRSLISMKQACAQWLGMDRLFELVHVASYS